MEWGDRLCQGGVNECDGDGLADEQEYMLGSNPFAQDSDGDGLLDGFEAAHGLDPTNGDTDGDGTPDGEEHDGNGGLYFWAQFADGVAVTAVTPSKAGWQRGESIGRNGTVRFDFDNLDGVALWATFEDGGYQREPFTLTATHATIRYGSELELVEWPLWRKTALIVPDDGAETFSVTVADERTGNPVTNEVYMGVDLAPWFDAVKLDVTAYRPQTEGSGYGHPFQRHAVPEEWEEEPGAGLRIHGGDAENDRLEVEVKVSKLSVATNFTYSLRFQRAMSASGTKIYRECLPFRGRRWFHSFRRIQRPRFGRKKPIRRCGRSDTLHRNERRGFCD